MKFKIQSAVMAIVVAVVLGNAAGSRPAGLQDRGEHVHNNISKRSNGLLTPPQAGGGPACAPSGAGCGGGG